MDQKDFGTLSYLSGGLPVKIVEPAAEPVAEVVTEGTEA
jgi:hypothetical protein